MVMTLLKQCLSILRGKGWQISICKLFSFCFLLFIIIDSLPDQFLPESIRASVAAARSPSPDVQTSVPTIATVNAAIAE